MEANISLVEAAEKTTLVRQLRELTAWIGDGRKLTQTGRITLADARALVDLLGTGDRVDPEIGGRVFKTASSEELRGLLQVVEWAKAVGLLRMVKARIVPVKKNVAVVNNPLELWERAFDAFGQLGEAICVTWMGPALMVREFEIVVPWLLSQLYAGPMKVTDLEGQAWELVTSPYVLDTVPEERLSSWRSFNDSDLRHVLAALEQLGAVRLTREDREIRTAGLTPLGLRTMRRRRGAPEPGDRVYQIKVTLRHSAEPEVWRRLLVPASIRLSRLHEFLQAAMGWENSHLHAFTVGKTRYHGFLDEPGDRSDDELVLSELAKRPGRTFEYEYDFGDSWHHDLVVEKFLEAEQDVVYPSCIAGEGACPPEDCGGIPGYVHLRESLADPGHVDHQHMLEWLGLDEPGDLDPAAFDLAEVNRALAAA